MLCDHIGYQMMMYGIGGAETASVLRIIGRISFPLFAFLIVQGFKKTHNILLYILRVLGAAIISEIPYNLCFYRVWRYDSGKNIMFTLALSLIALVFVDMCVKGRKEVRFFCVFPIIAACYFAAKFGFSYGYMGVLLIILMYFFDAGDFKGKLCIFPILLLFALRNVITAAIGRSAVSEWDLTQIYSVFSFIPILAYNGKPGTQKKSGAGKKAQQYFFYLFYPLHLILLYLIFSNFGKLAALF